MLQHTDQVIPTTMRAILVVVIAFGAVFEGAISQPPTCDAGLAGYLANRAAASDDVINELSSTLGAGASAADVYNSLVASNGVANTPKGMEDFMMALDTITEGYFKACYGPDDEKPIVSDSPDLLATFLELLANRSDPEAIRDLYGKLSCLKNFASGTVRKRQVDIGACAAETDITALYNCLDPGSRKCIFHLDSECSNAAVGNRNEPPRDCLGFVVDTTGSMAEEIAEVRNVIASFIQAEENRQTLCYTLVPFNDYSRVPEENSEYKYSGFSGINALFDRFRIS